MRSRVLILTIAVAAVLSACNRQESVTSSYGQRIVTGQVVMAGSPAGVEVTVVGTGMSATLGTDGRFTFIGVPDGAELSFHRADGIDTRLRIAATSQPLVVELSGSSARRRGVSPKDPGSAQQFEGVIRAVTSDLLTVFDSHRNEVKIALDATTTLIRKGNQTLSAADLNVDDRVHVKAVMINDVLTATQVIVQQQEGDDGDDQNGGTTMTANGLVKSVSGSTLVVQSQPKGDVTVQTDLNTIIRRQGVLITVADINAGDEVNCLGTRVDDHTLKARQIEVRGNSKKH